MRDESQEKLYNLFHEELSYIQKEGHTFAKKYPKTASYLELGNIGSYDPHVERLIEAFAFLSARLQYNIDEQFPQIISALLNVLYPQFSQPIPAMAIAHFQVDSVLCDSPTGFLVASNTPVFSQVHDETECEFQTCYPTTLWPIEVTNIKFEHPEKYTYFMDRADILSILSISLTCPTGNIKDFSVNKLRFYINLPDHQAHQIFELLFCSTTEVVTLNEKGEVIAKLGSDSIHPVGLTQDETILPCPNHTYKSYTTLTEYFLFERKFLFFDVDLPNNDKINQSTTIQIALSARNDKLRLSKTSFLLGCTPIINLFNRRSEPFRLDQKQQDYLLVPDKYNEQHVEIQSIKELFSFSSDGETTQVESLYSSSYLAQSNPSNCYWTYSRKPSLEEAIIGTTMHVSLVDKALNPNVPLGDVIYANCSCTNRYATNQIVENEVFSTTASLPVQNIRCVTKPTQKIQPSLSAKAQWRLLSALSYNHLYLLSTPIAIDSIRDILQTMSFSNQDSTTKEILGIKTAGLKPIVKRIGYEAWRGYCQGTLIELTFDRSYYSNSTPFLFAMVLERFFAHLTAVNSFTQLKIMDSNQKGVWKQWVPRTGEQQLI
jgi:type VI secretion system protein ImpG